MSRSFSVPYGDAAIRFTVRPGSTRTSRIAIHVERDGRVVVKAGAGVMISDIKAAVSRRAAWVYHHAQAAHARHAHVLPREYVSGESAFYLGRRYRLKVVLAPHADSRVAMRGPVIEARVGTRDKDVVRHALEQWYFDRARSYFAQRIGVLGSARSWVRAPAAVRVRWMQLRWGSCSPNGVLTLNAALVKAPRDCIDYVLLHELCHVIHHDHGPGFQRLLDAAMPGWRATKSRLDSMAEQLMNR